MTDDRWVVLGLAHPRAGWFSELARWSTTASVPVDFVKCMSGTEVRSRLDSGRPYSALLIGADLPALDRDLIDTARAAGVAVVLVGDRDTRAWSELGVEVKLGESFGRTELIAVLHEHATAISRVANFASPEPRNDDTAWRGALIAVTGPGGAGASTAAMALAQGLGAEPSNAGLVVLADLALNGDQGMLHDAREVIPGLQELVEAHRGPRLHTDEVRGLLFDATARGYHLLLGLRRHRDWTTIRPRALEAALESLQRTHRLVVADVDPDVEGEAETGSREVEDRNQLARSAVTRAEAVVVVGQSGPKGLHTLVRTIGDLTASSLVTADRVVPVINRVPRSPRRRAEQTAALGQLARTRGLDDLPNPVLMPERGDLDDIVRDGVKLPEALGRNLALEVTRRLGVAPRNSSPSRVEPVAVKPGELGSWTVDEEATG